MPLTSPPRTILDLAANPDGVSAAGGRGSGGPAPQSDPLSHHRLGDLENLVAQAEYRRLASERELRDQIERNPRKPGLRALRAVLDLPGGPRRTNSPGERALLRLLRERGIEGYEVNADIAGYEVDFLWRSERLAVEVDGYDGHSGRVAFERDRLKAATLKANGISTMPVTGRQIRRDPDGAIARLLAALRTTR
jgi:very-short-patch-repair endonuclease